MKDYDMVLYLRFHEEHATIVNLKNTPFDFVVAYGFVGLDNGQGIGELLTIRHPLAEWHFMSSMTIGKGIEFNGVKIGRAHV